MAHLQLLKLEYGDVKVKLYSIETLLRGLGYSSLTFEGDGQLNEWGNIYIVTKNGRYFTNSTMSTAVNWGKMCLTEDEFLNEAIREIRLFDKEEMK